MARRLRVNGFILLAFCGLGAPAGSARSAEGHFHRLPAPAARRQGAAEAGEDGRSGQGPRVLFCADRQAKSDQGRSDLAGPVGQDRAATVDWLSEEDLMPAGRTYRTEVPVTLDLAERARISVEGLSRFLDPRQRYSTYGHGWFCTKPPFMVHDQGASQNWGKVAEALVLTRRMSGSRAHLDIQLGSLGGMMDYAVAKSREPYPVPLARMLLTLVALHQQHPCPELVARINRYKDALVAALHVDAERNQAYFGPPEQRWHRADEENELGISGYWIQVFTGGSVLRALVVAAQI